MELPLSLNFGQARASIGSGGTLKNFYAQATPTGARADAILLGTPGAKLKTQLQYLNDANALTNETNINAMMYVQKWNRLLVVGEHAAYLMARNGTFTRFDGFGMSAPVCMAYNRADVAAVNGTKAFWINATSATPIGITDPDFYVADSVCFLDGYLVFNRKNTGQIFCTVLYGRPFNGLDFAEAEKAPDDTVGVLTAGDNLWVFGDATTEIWYNAANPTGLPFSRQPGATLEHGCAAIGTAQQFDGAVYWLTPTGVIIRAAGLSPARISDDQVEAALKLRRDEWATASAFIYSDEGHTFYCLTVGDLTLVYDEATQSWHQRSNYSRGCALGRCYAMAWGRHWIGDDSGRILEMSADYLDDAGEPIIGEIVSLPIANNRAFVSFGQIELQMATGGSPIGGDYGVLMCKTRDNGETWSTPRRASIGASGQRTRRVAWGKLGASKDTKFKFTVTDPFRRAVLASAELTA